MNTYCQCMKGPAGKVAGYAIIISRCDRHSLCGTFRHPLMHPDSLGNTVLLFKRMDRDACLARLYSICTKTRNPACAQKLFMYLF